MKNKKLWLGMLVMVLVFGMTVVGCGEEDGKTPFPTDGTLEEKLTWVSNGDNIEDGETYTIEVTADETISGHSISGSNLNNNITIVLKGIGAERKISFSDDSTIRLSVGRNVTLVLDENITLQGKSDSDSNFAPVSVSDGGVLEMKEGAKIIGHRTAGYGGGGVLVGGNGTFTMNGGTISGNTASGSSSYGGGGVYMGGGTFTMSGGTISKNTAVDHGGGVIVYSSSFNKTGGTITGYNSDTVNGNKARSSGYGHAVYAVLDVALIRNGLVLARIGIRPRKENTAGPGVNLYCRYIGNTDAQTWSGEWDAVDMFEL